MIDEIRATPVKCSATKRSHFSQREIARHFNISKVLYLCTNTQVY